MSTVVTELNTHSANLLCSWSETTNCHIFLTGLNTSLSFLFSSDEHDTCLPKFVSSFCNI